MDQRTRSAKREGGNVLQLLAYHDGMEEDVIVIDAEAMP
jgi:hypothetical protein